MSASASANAMPRNIVVRTVACHLGLAGHGLDGLADDEPMPMPGPMAARP